MKGVRKKFMGTWPITVTLRMNSKGKLCQIYRKICLRRVIPHSQYQNFKHYDWESEDAIYRIKEVNRKR
jgi:hypothetical protein